MRGGAGRARVSNFWRRMDVRIAVGEPAVVVAVIAAVDVAGGGDGS